MTQIGRSTCIAVDDNGLARLPAPIPAELGVIGGVVRDCRLLTAFWLRYRCGGERLQITPAERIN
jgi:hypothetical protein